MVVDSLIGSNLERFTDSLNLIPVTKLLEEMDFFRIESELHEHLNYAHSRRWIYPPILLLKLLIVLTFRKKSFRRLVSSLTCEDCIALGIEEDKDGIFHIPSASNVHDFAYNRLGEGFLSKLMMLNGSIASENIQNGNGMVDSTPIEASRYDKYAQYNPHYRINMYKMHIFHIDDFPLYEIFSDGNEHDAPYAIPLAEEVVRMKPSFNAVKLDGGYDSFSIYAHYWSIFDLIPIIDPRENAVISFEGTEERIDHWVNKKWQMGGNIEDSIENKLHFLYEQGRKEQVGMYLRNQNLLNQNFGEEYKSRSDCERTHSHMKRMFNFRVKWIQERSKAFYMALNFISYQILLLARLLNNERDYNRLENYI